MKRLSILNVALVVAVLVATVTVGVVVASRDDARTPMSSGMMVAGSSSLPGWWDDSWNSMGSMGSMMMGDVSPADEPEYLAEMVTHHEEAVAAARELARSDRPEMRAFGESIVASQSAQIEQMTSWLAEWYPDLTAAPGYEPMMRDLSDLTGDELDLAFLQDMIGHHMVAVMMSQQLLSRGTDHEQVASLAQSIRDDQHTEIVQMQGWLAEWFDADWRAGRGPGAWSGHGSAMGTGMMSGMRSAAE